MDGFIKIDAFRFDTSNNNLQKSNKFITKELMNMPLYKEIKCNPEEFEEMLPINNEVLELYCDKCNSKRIYTFAKTGIEYSSLEKTPTCGGEVNENNIPPGYKRMMQENQYFYFIAKADCGHDLIVLFKIIDENTIMKVGQNPSIYDMDETVKNKQFLKELGNQYKEHYRNACILNNYGFNIGAMTYLRRIFEKILMDCFNENKSSLNISEEDFKNLKMDAKVHELKEFLPEIIYESGYVNLYSKISDGIHNLSEEECKNLFVLFKMAIEEILIEKMELKKKKCRQKEIGKQLSQLN